MMITRNPRTLVTGLIMAGALSLALVGCSSEGPTPPSPAQTTSDAVSTSTPESAAHLTQEELSAAFDDIQFPAGQYDTSTDLLSSIYPGLTVSDTSCLRPFGAGWEDAAADTGAAVELGTSNDRSMTAVAVSSADPQTASRLFADAGEALDRCADGGTSFSMSGAPVDLQLETTMSTITGADDVLSWRATGEVAGSPFTLVGITAQRGGSVVALVAWDPATNETYAPAATQMFVDKF